MNYNCIVVLGPTASGKTRLACELAYRLNGEVISADSRQVYQYLNIGTGKDLDEYTTRGQNIPYHLIDIIHPSQQFYLHQFIEALKTAFDEITQRQKLPIICGGTGLYLDALRKDFRFTQIKENEALRKALDLFSKEELLVRLKEYPAELTAQVDLNSKKRIIRGIEIAQHLMQDNQRFEKLTLPYKPCYIGIDVPIEARKQLISARLTQRLQNGLIEEVQGLLDMGISEERLNLFGLEYKFVLQHLQQKISKDELAAKLQTAIFQFAKRQMTWFRKMEKEGVNIHWIKKDEPLEDLIAFISHE